MRTGPYGPVAYFARSFALRKKIARTRQRIGFFLKKGTTVTLPRGSIVSLK